MKKTNIIFLIITLFIAAITTSCDLKELDNFPAPDAELSGSFIDSETGELVEQDIIRGTNIKLIEHGYDPVAPQYLRVKNDGTYANRLLFANTYTIQPERGNFVQVDAQDVKIEGKTTLDFKVLPYIRLKDASIVKTGSKIVATFKLEQTVTNKVTRIGLYAHPEPNVGEPLRLLASEIQVNEVVSDKNKVFTIEMDLGSNSATLKPGKQYFFRVGALIDVGEAKFNYAPPVRIGI